MGYSILITNNSGDTQNIAVYQDYPGLSAAGFPLVWFNKSVPNGNSTTFQWNIDWALNWGTTEQQLSPGVMWTSSEPSQTMDPNSPSGNNAMGIHYTGSQFETNPQGYHDNNVPSGSLLVSTDKSFTVAQANLMSIAVYMNGLPTFAVQGKPNGKTLFNTHPTYWICTTEAKQGVAVSSLFVSSPTQCQFSAGNTALKFKLTDLLEFVPG